MKRRWLWILILLITLLIVTGLYVVWQAGSTPTNQLSPKSYVALGDSVAAGVGLQDASDASACERTNQSYPQIIARRLHYKLVSFACSGASIPSGITGSQTVNNLAETPQMTALFAQPKPALITITIGANDAGWSDVIRSCYVGQCGSAQQTAQVDAQIASLKTSFISMLQTLHDHYKAGQPKIVVTDYYQVYPVAKPANCLNLLGISDSELSWLRDQRTKINAAIQGSVTSFPSVSSVGTNFSGHELCTNDSWVQGLTASYPYHPTAAGQAAIASAIIKAIGVNK